MQARPPAYRARLQAETEDGETAGHTLRRQNDERRVRLLGDTQQTRPHGLTPWPCLGSEIEDDQRKPAATQKDLRTTKSFGHRRWPHPQQPLKNDTRPSSGLRVQGIGNIHPRHHTPPTRGCRQQGKQTRRLAGRQRSRKLAQPPPRQTTSEYRVDTRQAAGQSLPRFDEGAPEQHLPGHRFRKANGRGCLT
jgi:hypothetical protein